MLLFRLAVTELRAHPTIERHEHRLAHWSSSRSEVLRTPAPADRLTEGRSGTGTLAVRSRTSEPDHLERYAGPMIRASSILRSQA